VRDLLRAEVLDGNFGQSPLITEAELGLQFSVSRGVIREALDLLRHEGLIVRLQGAGTFAVASKRSAQGIDRLTKITDELERGSARVTWEVLDVDEYQAPPFLAKKLELAPGSTVIVLERLMILDGRPLSVRTSWFPDDVGRPLLHADTELHLQIYDMIEGLLGFVVFEVALQLEPTTADAITAPVLGVEIGAPLQLMERVIHGPDGRPIEYGHGRSRGDRFVNRTVLRLPHSCRRPGSGPAGDDRRPQSMTASGDGPEDRYQSAPAPAAWGSPTAGQVGPPTSSNGDGALPGSASVDHNSR
jgi:GntR family transcriptional regulator